MNLNTIYQRVSNWNAKRYDRETNLTLLGSLIREELNEHYESDSEVHQLDGLCDVVYVALGGLWKANISEEELNYNLSFAHTGSVDLMRANVLKPKFYIAALIDAVEHDSEFPLAFGLLAIVNMCMIEMQNMGLTLEQCYKALEIVCDSNDTKSIPKDKVDPSVKANINKGELFVAPEPRLQKLLESRYG